MRADGSKHCANESTVTTRADHEEIGADRAETVSGIAADRLQADHDLGLAGESHCSGELAVDEVLCPGVIVRIDKPSLDGDGRRLPNVDEGDGVA